VDVHARHYDRTAIAAALKAWRLLLLTKGGEHSAGASRRESSAYTHRRIPGHHQMIEHFDIHERKRLLERLRQ